MLLASPLAAPLAARCQGRVKGQSPHAPPPAFPSALKGTCRLGRRGLLGVVGGGLLSAGSSRASSWSEPQFSEAPGAGIPYRADDFALQWPSGWQELRDLNPEISVKASYINPSEPAETFAIFVVETGKSSMREFGSPKEYAAYVAGMAPNYECTKFGSHKRGGVLFYDLQMVAGGGTAGRFGAAVELLSIGIKEGKEFTARGSATKYRFGKKQVRRSLQAAVDSFDIL